MKRTILFIALVILVGNQYSTAQNQVTHFDGTNDMINLGGDAGNEIRSIELWFKPANDIFSNNYERITLVTRNTDDQNGEFGIYIGYGFPGEQGRVTFTRQVDSIFYYIYSDTNEWSAATWYHVAAVIDPGSGMKLYIDGILQDDTDPSVQPTDNQTEMTTLGCWGDKLIRWFEGNIDEVRFWERAISSDEIIENMCDTINPQTAEGLKGYWRMNEGTGHTAIDLSGMNYHGDLFGCTYLQDSICVITTIPEIHDQSRSYAFPNPVLNNTTIVFPNDNNETCELKIFNPSGQLIYSEAGFSGNEIKFFRNDMPPGIYSYIIKAGKNKQYSGKLIFN